MTHRARSGPLTFDAAVDECCRESGRQFDPGTVEALLDARRLLPALQPAPFVAPLRLVSAPVV